MKQIAARTDCCTNTLTTVQKDNYILQQVATRFKDIASTVRANGNRKHDKNVLDSGGYEGVVTIIDDTQGFDGVRIYDDCCPTLRSQRSGLKILYCKGENQ